MAQWAIQKTLRGINIQKALQLITTESYEDEDEKVKLAVCLYACVCVRACMYVQVWGIGLFLRLAFNRLYLCLWPSFPEVASQPSGWALKDIPVLFSSWTVSLPLACQRNWARCRGPVVFPRETVAKQGWLSFIKAGGDLLLRGLEAKSLEE